MLDTLLEMEIATKVLQQTADEEGDDPLETNYKKLHCHLTPLDRDSEEWKIVRFFINTHIELVLHFLSRSLLSLSFLTYEFVW
jgi:poly [ADP-ribose] polymerase